MISKMERAALEHAAGELAYRKSPQYHRDQIADAERRVKADRAAGHLPTCGLLRCAPGCTHENK